MNSFALQRKDSPEERFRAACSVFYGICCPQNYKTGYLQFLDCIERGQHVESMIMVAECLSSGKGVEKDESLGLAWLERAGLEHGNAIAKGRFASKLLDEIRCKKVISAIKANEHLTQVTSPETVGIEKFLEVYDESTILRILGEAAAEG